MNAGWSPPGVRQRTARVAVAAAVVLAACSGGEDVPAGGGVSSAPAPSETLADDPVRDAADAGGSTTTVASEPPEPVWSVGFDVAVEGFDAPEIDASTSLEFAPGDPGDPFGIAAACSGLNDEAAAYSVFVSGGAAIWYVGLWTSDPLRGAGIYDVQIRVEHGGVGYDATGTVTLDEGVRSGEFLAFGADGGEISGSFTCAGAGPAEPLALGAADGGLDSIDVFALLRRNGAIRVAGMATTEVLIASCPAVVAGDDQGPLVSVRGGPGVGSIASFEATGDAVSMRVGSIAYEFGDAVVLQRDGAGTIAGQAPDGTILDAAYRCT